MERNNSKEPRLLLVRLRTFYNEGREGYQVEKKKQMMRWIFLKD